MKAKPGHKASESRQPPGRRAARGLPGRGRWQPGAPQPRRTCTVASDPQHTAPVCISLLRAAVTRCHGPGAYTTKTCFLTLLEAGSLSSERERPPPLLSPLSLVIGWLSSPCVFPWVSLCTYPCPNFLFFPGSNHTGLVLTLMTSFYFFKSLHLLTQFLSEILGIRAL